MDGKPFLVLVRENLPELITRGTHAWRIDMIMSFESENEAGFPTETTLNEMVRLEEELCSTFEQDRQTMLSHVFTGEGQREWTWYTDDKVEFMARFQKYIASIWQTTDNINRHRRSRLGRISLYS